MNTLEALTTIREQSNLSDDEWVDLCESVSARQSGVSSVTKSRVVVDTGDMSKISAWVTVHQLASVLGIDPGLARQWKLRGKLPKPDELIGGRAVWSRRTVKLWAQELTRLANGGT